MRKTFKQGGLLGDSSVWQLCLTALHLIIRPAVMHSADGPVNLQMYLQNAQTLHIQSLNVKYKYSFVLVRPPASFIFTENVFLFLVVT